MRASRARSSNLFDLIDGSLDGDALFFSRKLRVTGDTEAVVALRNALDDVDGGVVESITRAFGPLAADRCDDGLTSAQAWWQRKTWWQ